MRSRELFSVLLAACVGATPLACDADNKQEDGGAAKTNADESKADGNKPNAAGKASADDKAENGKPLDNADGKGEAAAAPEETVSAEPVFDSKDKSIRKRACEWLTAELVASTFGIPAEELKQMKMMGCMYTWRKDGQIVDAKIMMPRVHKNLAGAKMWFNNATATKTSEQLAAEMDQLKTKAKAHDKLDTKLKKKVAGDLTDIAKLGMPDGGVRYDDVPGVGSQARVSSADGVLWVRLGNLTFQVTGYKGPDQPKPEVDLKNIDGIAKAAMKAQKDWIAATVDARKAGATKLAPLVVKAIAKP